jgi:hypothetical protein
MLSVSSNTRRALSACAFALILLAGFQRDLFVIVFSDRRPLQRAIESVVDQSAPGYPDFLREVWRRTRPGETILLLFRPAQGQPPRWYAYYRARYFLPDRVVRTVDTVPSDPDTNPLDRVRYIAAWGTEIDESRFETIWRGSGGQLAERRRP